MKLFIKRHYTSFSHSTASQIIHLCRSGSVSQAIFLLSSINSMPHTENSFSKPIVYATIVHACLQSLQFNVGLQLHCHLTKSGLESDRFVGNSLLALYYKLGSDFTDTQKFFDGLCYKDVVAWSSMISGYTRAGRPRNAIGLYLEMLDSGIEANAFSLSAVIKACGEVRGLNLGKCLHGVVVRCGFECNGVIVAALIDMYGKGSEPAQSRQLFDEMSEPDSVCCTSVISALTRSDLYQDAIGMFYQMCRKRWFLPDWFTFGSVLMALGNLERLKQGREVHGHLLTGGFHKNVFVDSSLVDMYAKCGMIDESQRVFDRMDRKNSVSSCALIGGYCRKGEFETVIKLFRNMEKDLYSFGTVLRACAGLAAEKLGKEVHCQYLKRGSWRDVVVESALVDLYAKCGCIDFANQIFSKMPVKNLITWNSMMGGFAQNGRGIEAIKVFDEMIQENVRPDNISFLEVLFACSHSGLVEQGHKYFISMKNDFGLKPGIEHYSCMIDLLGRAGKIEDAEDLINNAEFRNEHSLWATLLGSCGTTTDPNIAERVAMKMIELKPDYHLSYVLLANVYRAVGRWKDSHKIWKQMQNRGVQKMPGKSWIHNSHFNAFVSLDPESSNHGDLYDDATCGTPVWRDKGITCVCFKRKGSNARVCINLTPLQAERLKRLRNRTEVYFDASRPEHQEALRVLWYATYPGQELQSLVSDQWKEMGWQGKGPSTDFRGAGFISLENLLFFAKTFSTSFQSLLRKQVAKGAMWEYPFAVAGVNLTFMIMQMLDLDATKPRTFIRAVFVQMLSENKWAFDLLYCVAVMIMDKLWLERNATYIEFNEILKSTRCQLEKEFLMDDVLRIEDMPSYSLLS